MLTFIILLLILILSSKQLVKELNASSAFGSAISTPFVSFYTVLSTGSFLGLLVHISI